LPIHVYRSWSKEKKKCQFVCIEQNKELKNTFIDVDKVVHISTDTDWKAIGLQKVNNTAHVQICLILLQSDTYNGMSCVCVEVTTRLPCFSLLNFSFLEEAFGIFW
jgi:hypothetical protein